MRRAHEYASDVVTVAPEASCLEVADRLDLHGVGCVVVVESDGRPVGMITDRDLSSRVVAAGRDPESTLARDIATRDLVLGSPADHVGELLTAMRERGVRRVPLVEDGRLVAIISLDDLVMELSSQLYNVSEAVWVALRESRRTVRHRRRRESREDAFEELREQVASLGEQARAGAAKALEELLSRLRRDSS